MEHIGSPRAVTDDYFGIDTACDESDEQIHTRVLRLPPIQVAWRSDGRRPRWGGYSRCWPGRRVSASVPPRWRNDTNMKRWSAPFAYAWLSALHHRQPQLVGPGRCLTARWSPVRQSRMPPPLLYVSPRIAPARPLAGPSCRHRSSGPSSGGPGHSSWSCSHPGHLAAGTVSRAGAPSARAGPRPGRCGARRGRVRWVLNSSGRRVAGMPSVGPRRDVPERGEVPIWPPHSRGSNREERGASGRELDDIAVLNWLKHRTLVAAPELAVAAALAAPPIDPTYLLRTFSNRGRPPRLVKLATATLYGVHAPPTPPGWSDWVPSGSPFQLGERSGCCPIEAGLDVARRGLPTRSRRAASLAGCA